MNFKSPLIAGFALFAFVAAAAQVDPQRVVATVNGEEIKGAEYYHRMEYLPGVAMRLGANYAEFPPGFMTLYTLVNERLVLMLAKQKGVIPSDAEIDAEFRSRLTQNPQLLDQWVASGRTKDELLAQIKLDLAQFKLATFGITVTDQEVKTFYTEHPTLFTIPKRVQLRVVVVSSEDDKAEVDRQLVSGKPFADIASSISLDLSKTSGGEYGTVPIGTLSPDAQNAVSTVQQGQTTSWITSGGLFIKFLVEKVLPEQLQPLTPEVLNATRRRMMVDRGSVKNDVAHELDQLRATVKVDIKQKEFADVYAKFVKAYLGERDVQTPKQGAPSASSGN